MPGRFESLGLETVIEQNAVNEITDDGQVADDRGKFPPGELVVEFPDLEGKKGSRHENDQIFRPMLAEVQPNPLRRKQRRVKKGGITEQKEPVRSQGIRLVEQPVDHPIFRIEMIGDDEMRVQKIDDVMAAKTKEPETHPDKK